ncbi:hypothetical protein M3G00_03695 [Brevibacterium casei]|nr:hypothetical protein [Brevibacterium casei]MBE4694338.1 hypothetical protein [Brevibacterium casei]MBY3577460.1 hypothetical protein [Brevibacterium casei]MCT2182036.1 hypothetical protein [Brevibacterium casei]
MRMAHELTDAELMELVVQPAIDRIFHEGELDSVELFREDDGSLLAEFIAGDEQAGSWLHTPGVEISVEDLAERVVSDLQDFVAESSFGWGELRGE